MLKQRKKPQEKEEEDNLLLPVSPKSPKTPDYTKEFIQSMADVEERETHAFEAEFARQPLVTEETLTQDSDEE
jgi:hypothetical protein